MDLKAALTLAIPAFVALMGLLAKYLNDLKIAQRKDRLDRISRQLKEFYGPLFALAHASEIAWYGFRSKYRPDAQSYWRSEPPPNEEEAAAWRLWMSEVFMPLNIQMERRIVENADLLEDTVAYKRLFADNFTGLSNCRNHSKMAR